MVSTSQPVNVRGKQNQQYGLDDHTKCKPNRYGTCKETWLKLEQEQIMKLWLISLLIQYDSKINDMPQRQSEEKTMVKYLAKAMNSVHSSCNILILGED